jgi:two-component system sensor histidine kinase KdpD
VSDDRPSPDAILARLTAEREKASRGRLHVFFGFAPGVGKTYRMLESAHHALAKGIDVVVGVVETHGRRDTEAQLAGLPILPRRSVSHRGTLLQELDLDAALARKPGLLLVDELAHTNAPGSRHPKRWQDVIELLDAGIDVLTTLNVQHVESLNDVVAQITQVVVRETVPDSVLSRADPIEVVDLPPEALLSRLAEGKVYVPEQAERAAAHFFSQKNLMALRELALRQTAQHVDADVVAYRAQHGVEETWRASERILVCVGPSPSSDGLVRSASRLAAGLHAPWIAAYVESIERPSNRERLEKHLRLAETLGAQVVRLEGAQVGEALLRYAREHSVTRILLGKPTHARFLDRLRGSLLDDVVRGSAGIDVQVIGGTEVARAPVVGAEHGSLEVRPYFLATLAVAASTLIGLGLRAALDVPDVEVLYVLAVLVVAARLGRGPSVLTAALGVAAYDFFFVPPFHTFAVTDARHLLTFGLMFGVGLLVSALTDRIRRQERGAIERERRTAALYALSRDLGAATGLDAVLAIVARHATALIDGAAHVLVWQEGALAEGARCAPAGMDDAPLPPKELGVARWAFDHRSAAGLGTGTLPAAGTQSIPLVVGDRAVGVLSLRPRLGTALDQDRRAALEPFVRQAAFAVERIQLAHDAEQASLAAKTEELRSSLLSAVSHDLRTPLAVITGAATTLRDEPSLDAVTGRELLGSIVLEAERLERLVGSLLDMTRLEGAVEVKREWVPLEELAVSALSRTTALLGERPVAIDFAEMPLASVDAVLIEQLLVNLLENAAKYTEAGSPIDIVGSASGAELRIEVRDRGPGIPANQVERIFDKFVRGERERAWGVGLGLAICRAIAVAHGGSITAANRDGGGTIFAVTLPRISGAPSIVPDAP